MAKETYNIKQVKVPKEAQDNINEVHEYLSDSETLDKKQKAELWIAATERLKKQIIGE